MKEVEDSGLNNPDSINSFHITQTQLADHIPFQIPKASPVSQLAQASVTIYSSQAESVTEHVAVINHPLHGNNFYNFLCTTANTQAFGGIDGVVADWRMPDLTHFDANYERLQKMHERLGKDWTVFEEHRAQFMKAIQEKTVDVPDEISSTFIAPHNIAATIATILVEGKNEKNASFFDVFNQFSKSELLNFLKNTRKNPHNTNRETILSKEGLKNRLLQRLKESEVKKNFPKNFSTTSIDPEFIAAHFVEFELDLGEEELVKAYKLKDANGNVDAIREDFETDKAKYRLIYKKNGTFAYKKVSSKQFALLPTIHWKKEEDKTTASISRTIYTGNLPLENLPETENNYYENAHGDSLIGLLAIALLSPDIRTKWPKQAGLPAAGYAQTIGPAQIPVMALIRQKNLEKSDLLASFETVAQTSSHEAY